MPDSADNLSIALLIRTEIDRALADLRRFNNEAKNSVGDAAKGAKAGEIAFTSFEKVLATLGIGFSIEKVLEGIKSLVHEAGEAERLEGRINAVLTATGRISQVSGEALNGLAEQVAETTRFTKQEAQDALTTLLTFTNVATSNFEQTIEAASGLASVMGTDLRTATQQLGKVLNEPVKSLDALARIGIRFTDAQAEMIKKMVRFGDVAGAQKLILDDLAKRGLGSAAAGENQGLFKATNDVAKAWGELLVAFGRTPAVKATVETVLGALAGGLQEAKKRLAPNEDERLAALAKRRDELERSIAENRALGADVVVREGERELAMINAQLDAIFKLHQEENARSEDARKAAASKQKLTIGDDVKNDLKEQENRLALIGAETEAQKVLAEIEKGKFKDLNPLEQQALLAVAKRIDLMTQETAQIKANTDAWKARTKALEDDGEKVRDAVDPVRVLNRELERLDELEKQDLITPFERNVRAFDIKNQAGQIREGFKEIKDESDVFRDQMQRNLQTAFSDDIFQVLEGRFDHLSDVFVNMLRRMAAEALARQALLALGGIFGAFGASPEALDLAAGVRPLHSGGVVGRDGGSARSVPLAAFAGAPRLHRGGFLGLASDEIPAILQRGETVIPKGGMDGGGVKVSIENKGSPIQASDAKVTFDAEGMVVRIMTKDAERGGPISSTFQRTFGLKRGAR